MQVNDVWEVRFWTALGDQAAVNVTHWRVVSIGTGGAKAVEIAEAFSNLADDKYIELMCNDSTFNGAQAQKIWPLPKESAGEWSNQATGIAGASPLPAQTCGLISLRGDLADRHNRGRLYIPFPCEESNGNDHRPTGAYTADAETLMTTIFTPQTVVGATGNCVLAPVIYNRLTHGTVAITGGKVRNKWATQRRRSDFGAKNTSPV